MEESKSTILIVDDEPFGRDTLESILEPEGYNLVMAENGYQAIEKARDIQPDVILLDVMMPGMNGLDATHRIRQYQALRETPIVAVSAYGTDEYRGLALEAGCDEYVSTPFEPSELAELITNMLAGGGPSHLDAQTSYPGY